MTLMDEAKKGNIPPQINKVAEEEGIDPEIVRKYVAEGVITIPKNVLRETSPKAIGKCMGVKVNANVGTSRDFVDVEDEVKKAETAVKYGADSIMDLSTGGDLDSTRKLLMKAVDVPFGTVPIYQAASSQKTVVDMTSDDIINAVRKHAEDGVDFVTIHAGVNQNALQRLRKGDRIMDVVSRGGSFTIAWMIHNEQENPLYSEFDYLIEIAREYDMTLSLGDGMRPGCIHDASDNAKFMEFITLGELVKEARNSNVQTFVEGPGHVAADEVQLSVKSMKQLCHDAPLYLLGPLVTDIAPGYDHITGAIGGTIAGMSGADFLCMTTPAEHLALPTADDIREGAIITKIAAHAADLTRHGQREKARQTDLRMAQARRDLDWEKQFEVAIDSEKPAAIRQSRKTGSDACSMCGELCALKIVQDALKGNTK
ncbi:phosphomethylpyrimidine synthase ThiC [Methanohalophilus halophilus]|uniref:Phosphomethylpyrimidine synthase n=1 Tax=Methanohalophilus halophilus TaxID=2177 RepID=A0A1L3Q4I9_9EURY|nr:phosphomethylpyrimidine synthase ThiC [Methanohalophilus halophilus]APH39671.1 phosphomethylpyrimidine synthase [Methanohalophilus halophilus]RNI08994.1 phosphomethylpyrimidine synthase ThiC [Methanohalophilus halophilus]SDW35297.1 hydroxymethylpyrimidine synthase [Methanohalophilus halophilus]